MSRPVPYAESAFDFRVEVCHRVRARIRTRLRHLRGTTPWIRPHGVSLDGRFGVEAVFQNSPVERFESLGRVEIPSNVPKRLLGAFSWLLGAFSCSNSMYPMPEHIAGDAMHDATYL